MSWFSTTAALRKEIMELKRINDHLHAENKELLHLLDKAQAKSAVRLHSLRKDIPR